MWIQFGLSIIAGLAASILTYGLFNWRWKYILKQYEGTYEAYDKYSGERVDDRKIRLSASGSYMLFITVDKGLGNYWQADISMNTPGLKSGQGFYIHDQMGRELWGFYDIVINNTRDTTNILVHKRFFDRKTDGIVERVFKWKKIEN